MNAKFRHSFLLVLALWLAATSIAPAQSTPFRSELLSLLPEDFGICVIMHDLHGHSARLERAEWFKAFQRSPLGKSILESPDFQNVRKMQGDLEKHLDLDWPTLRDDILGDTLILAYSPGAEEPPKQERGLILLHVRKPARLAQFIDRLNTVQEKSGDLKSLTAISYKGAIYHRREEKSKIQFYFIDGALAAVTSQEDIIKAFLDKRAPIGKDHAWAKRFERAGAEQAFLTLGVNPRQIQPDFGPNVRRGDGLPSYWRALEGIFVTLTIQDDAHLRISLQANSDALPKWARSAFTQTAPPSDLWQRFPEQSILTIAARLDFAGTMDGFKSLLPESDRKAFMDGIQKTFQAMLKLDPFDDILPNVGPDWGICILPAKNPQQLPILLAAVAVKPGAKKPAVDQKLLEAVHALAGFAVLDHNAKNPDAPMRLEVVMQGDVEVKYLSCVKAFPPGVQPACALKDGYLILASSPDAIARFHDQGSKAVSTKETPVLRLTTRALAKLLEQRRDHVLSRLPEKDAEQHFANVLSLLNLFDRVTLSQHGEAGQASWSIRLTPAQHAK